ncbi:uncharacterized protein LOC110037665 [Phalaenopsis equestris]|uniref:uncharacterized protein LOC110037665 n=1 Tax=Phalaenopsis equestris TaxID=78828 RepID=UPI0009E4340D|nr:uncharacterized protein LOC110037665 [Phalaenopsis equestris]
MADPIPPPSPSALRHRPLLKHRSWSPDLEREETWERRKDLHRLRRSSRVVRSVTEDDFDELRGCIDLGIVSGDGSLESGDCSKIAKILPALDLYLAVQRGLNGSVSTGRSTPSEFSSSVESPDEPHLSMFFSGSTPSEVKGNLKQWAQVVACSLNQSCGVRRYPGG